MPTIQFKIDGTKCTQCGLCAADCPANIIVMTDNGPIVPSEKESFCYKCEHCLAVCPTAAVSVLGLDPLHSIPLSAALPGAAQMEALIKGRRSVRRYKDEDIDPELLQRLLDVAWHAPTGKNDRQVRLTVIDKRETLAKFRLEAHAGIERLAMAGKLPPGMERFADFPKLWADRKVDILFRGAPHLLVTSAPKNSPSPVADCFIAMAYFELFAQTQGVGTVWDGLFKWTMDMLPELKKTLAIPEDHLIGYAMAFGYPAVRFTRTVQHKPAIISKVVIS